VKIRLVFWSYYCIIIISVAQVDILINAASNVHRSGQVKEFGNNDSVQHRSICLSKV